LYENYKFQFIISDFFQSGTLFIVIFIIKSCVREIL
jgi:hypothetical protein